MRALAFLSISYSILAFRAVALGAVLLRALAVTIMFSSAFFVALFVATYCASCFSSCMALVLLPALRASYICFTKLEALN